MIVSQTFTP